MMTIILCFRCH